MYDLLIKELGNQKINDFKIWDCVVLTSSVVESISESFKMIINDAKSNKCKECIIFEDDIMFTNFNSWEYFIENKPTDFDVYLGGNYLIDNRLDYTKSLVKVKGWVGNHCIIINEKYYDTWLKTDSKLHCDTAQSGLGDFYVCYPYPALQRTRWSSNNKAICNYNSALRPEDIWQGFPT